MEGAEAATGAASKQYGSWVHRLSLGLLGRRYLYLVDLVVRWDGHARLAWMHSEVGWLFGCTVSAPSRRVIIALLASGGS